MKSIKRNHVSTSILVSVIVIMLVFMHTLTQAVNPFTHSVTLENKDRVYQFSVIYQEINIRKNSHITYYWLRNGQLQTTIGDYAGNIVHGDYQEFSKSGKMLEKGTFIYGKKDGEWRSWNKNGEIIKLEQWRKGFLKKRWSYDPSKRTIESYERNQINRRRIINNDRTKNMVEHYRKGILVDNSKKIKKPHIQTKKQQKSSDVIIDK
ncbi:MAG TPA: hypothetical protein VK205_14590 [Prolixibacteraceae bacterium]|nr:hypothetical protein [Prolixibacteraceae bacterium]